MTQTAQDSLRGDVIGLIPAGGQATRIAPLPCSKELFPIGFRPTATGDLRPKVVAHYLLDKMRIAGIKKAYLVLRPGKWDIPGYFGDGSLVGMNLAYLTLGLTYGVPFTVDQAYPFVVGRTIAFGFPDILFNGDDGFISVLARHGVDNSDITLGLFPANDSFSRQDRVDVDGDGHVRAIVISPESDLRHSWAIAVWGPNFTQFLHHYVVEKKATVGEGVELSAGHAFQAAIEGGLRVSGVVVGDRPYLDIGTPDGLREAISLIGERQAG
jgi:glucose-1-phosphate thymidylyltransferase